jgi:hypothetical protein
LLAQAFAADEFDPQAIGTAQFGIGDERLHVGLAAGQLEVAAAFVFAGGADQ